MIDFHLKTKNLNKLLAVLTGKGLFPQYFINGIKGY
jgi:hypothetical protein